MNFLWSYNLIFNDISLLFFWHFPILFYENSLADSNQSMMIVRMINNTRYSKTCVKRPLKKRQTKYLNDKW